MKNRFRVRLTTLIVLVSLCSIGAAYAAFTGGGGSVAEDTDRSKAAVLLIVYMMLALGFSFLCSIAEAVLLSLRPSYIESQRVKAPKVAKRMQRLKLENIDRSLAAILTLNTIAHTVGAIGSGAEAAILFGNTWFGLFSAIMTLMILFLSEIIPKTIGAVYWERLAKPTTLFIQWLIYILYPIVWLSERLTKIVSGGKELHIFSRDEFVAMAKLGEESGHLNLKETRIILNLFRMGSLKVVDIMTPRTVVQAFSETATVDDVMNEVMNNSFSRIPVYTGDVDHITGFVLRDDILVLGTEGRGGETMASIKREIPAVPETMTVSALFEMLMKDNLHIALVMDEYGGTKGLVTLEDVIETLIGAEIMDELDQVEDMRILARKLWEKRSRAMGAKYSAELAADS